MSALERHGLSNEPCLSTLNDVTQAPAMKEAARDENPKLAVEQCISTEVEKFRCIVFDSASTALACVPQLKRATVVYRRACLKAKHRSKSHKQCRLLEPESPMAPWPCVAQQMSSVAPAFPPLVRYIWLDGSYHSPLLWHDSIVQMQLRCKTALTGSMCWKQSLNQSSMIMILLT